MKISEKYELKNPPIPVRDWARKTALIATSPVWGPVVLVKDFTVGVIAMGDAWFNWKNPWDSKIAKDADNYMWHRAVKYLERNQYPDMSPVRRTFAYIGVSVGYYAFAVPGGIFAIVKNWKHFSK
ncbi:MAG: hypothetical protein FWE17_01980 [Alphaproteobacteria bacterium]|nr:hypothetical protein [Alphaproteobacteria bacterium]MCL2757793.1 hypothetical protein [Alphaproteobacteria bacterium]